MGQRPRPTRAHLISWAAEREEYYSHSWNVQGMSVTVETCQMLLHYGKGHALYQRNWPQVVDNEVEPNCIGSQKVMSSDLHLFTGWQWLQWPSCTSLGSQTAARLTTYCTRKGSVLCSGSTWSWKVYGVTGSPWKWSLASIARLGFPLHSLSCVVLAALE